MLEVVHYFDYKSPYAFIAQQDTFQLAEDFAIELVLVPLTLHIPSFLGHAELDDNGNVIVNERSEHQWRRVKYVYMDCRREANRRNLVLRGPRKVFDSSIAHIGFLYASQQGDPRAYHNRVFELFWKRELDIEDPLAIAEQLEVSGIDSTDFASFLDQDGRRQHDRLCKDAEDKGVFGAPSYILEGELFWGSERLPRIRERLQPVAKQTALQE